MNLAFRAIRHDVARFALTCLGIGMLLLVVLGMGGIYRGILADATLLVDAMETDLWVVQRDTRGPFAEISRVPPSLLHRVRAVPGVSIAREFVFHTIQREREGKPIRLAVVGLSWPVDKGESLKLVAGRALQQGHFELIADDSLGLALGERIRLGRDSYAVVGLTHGMMAAGGDGLIFTSLADSQAIQFDSPGEAMRLEREARRVRAARANEPLVQPSLLERAGAESSALPILPQPTVSAVLAGVHEGTDAEAVSRVIQGWGDVSAYTGEAQKQLLLQGNVAKVKAQIGLFRVLLTIIAAIIMALILYTLTLDRLHDIALLKLMGAPTRVIVSFIIQQALLIGVIGFAIAMGAGQWIFPLFPRRVILTDFDLVQLGVIVFVISILSSLVGLWKALRVSPNEALVG